MPENATQDAAVESAEPSVNNEEPVATVEEVTEESENSSSESLNEDELKEKLEAINKQKRQKAWQSFIAGVKSFFHGLFFKAIPFTWKTFFIFSQIIIFISALKYLIGW